MTTELTIKAETERIQHLSEKITSTANLLIDINREIANLEKTRDDMLKHVKFLKDEADSFVFLSDETQKANPNEPFANTTRDVMKVLADDVIPGLMSAYDNPRAIEDNFYDFYALPDYIRNRYHEEKAMWEESQKS